MLFSSTNPIPRLDPVVVAEEDGEKKKVVLLLLQMNVGMVVV